MSCHSGQNIRIYVTNLIAVKYYWSGWITNYTKSNDNRRVPF